MCRLKVDSGNATALVIWEHQCHGKNLVGMGPVWEKLVESVGVFQMIVNRGSSLFMDVERGQQYSHHVFLAVGIKKWIPLTWQLCPTIQYVFFLEDISNFFCSPSYFQAWSRSPRCPKSRLGFQGNKLFIGGWLHCHLAHYWVFTDCSLHFTGSQAVDVGLMMSNFFLWLKKMAGWWIHVGPPKY